MVGWQCKSFPISDCLLPILKLSTNLANDQLKIGNEKRCAPPILANQRGEYDQGRIGVTGWLGQT